MSHFFKTVLLAFQKKGIGYILGAESLVGFAEQDHSKYTHNLRIYLFPTSPLKLLSVSLGLLLKGIILKPKLNMGHLFFKLRYKPNLFSKDSSFVTLTPLKPVPNGFTAYLGGHDTFYSSEDLNISSLKTFDFDGVTLSLPHEHERFIQKYRQELLSGFYKKHEVAFDSESEKKAVRFMHENVAFMKASGIVFWIEGGTLLGALRDQKLIPWDHDLDFGMKYESEVQMKKLIRKLRRHFYVSVRNFPKTDKIWHLGNYRVLKIFPRKHLFFKDDLCLDLFVYYEGTLPDTEELVYKYVVWDRNAYHRKEFLDKPETISFYGNMVPVPANPEKFIEVKYGKDWRTPIKEWNVALDDGSIYRSE